MFVLDRMGSKILYLFSQIRIVCAFMPERFSRSFMLNTLLTLFELFIISIKLLNKCKNKYYYNWVYFQLNTNKKDFDYKITSSNLFSLSKCKIVLELSSLREYMGLNFAPQIISSKV